MWCVRGAAVVLASFFALPGCLGIPGLPVPGGVEGEGEGGCTGDFPITVGSGTSPTFTFDGLAAGLAVADFPDGSKRHWVISQGGAEGFSGPVTYGAVPAGALEAEGSADALEAGTEYSVTITNSPGNQASCQTFTP